MHLAKRCLPKHARARLIAWALAMLMWLGAALSGAIAVKARHQRQRVDFHALTRLTLLVKRLIISRAGDFARLRPPKRFGTAYRGRPVARAGLIRALIGSQLRRALKRRDIFKHICALIAALRQIDVHAAHLARRMRRRLTRLTPILSRPCDADVLVSRAAAETAFADSS
ncbi:MAG: hypothetical protein ACK4X1_11230 [Terricaulis sp.]